VRRSIASLYIQAIEATTTPSIAHGDAHHGNIILEPPEPGFSFVSRLKLVDFGTSRFLGRADWRKRHRATVDKTFRKLLKSFDGIRSIMRDRHNSDEQDTSERIRGYKEVLVLVREQVPWTKDMFAASNDHLLRLVKRRKPNEIG
jgi:predicted unusual protein kinase regulating ubiquinone biosynthesis (AarF/ABC1/UbiB family)